MDLQIVTEQRNSVAADVVNFNAFHSRYDFDYTHCNMSTCFARQAVVHL